MSRNKFNHNARLFAVAAPNTDFRRLQRGEITWHGDLQDQEDPGMYLVCCPGCGEIAALGEHRVYENLPGTVSITPSLVCTNEEKKCKAHYIVAAGEVNQCAAPKPGEQIDLETEAYDAMVRDWLISQGKNPTKITDEEWAELMQAQFGQAPVEV